VGGSERFRRGSVPDDEVVNSDNGGECEVIESNGERTKVGDREGRSKCDASTASRRFKLDD
jgi:hypothetical protein